MGGEIASPKTLEIVLIAVEAWGTNGVVMNPQKTKDQEAVDHGRDQREPHDGAGPDVTSQEHYYRRSHTEGAVMHFKATAYFSVRDWLCVNADNLVTMMSCPSRCHLAYHAGHGRDRLLPGPRFSLDPSQHHLCPRLPWLSGRFLEFQDWRFHHPC